MRKNILNEINDMKYLFAYKRGVVISEQEIFEDKNYDNEDYNYLKLETVDEEYDDFELEEDIDFDVPTMMPGTKEKERTITPGVKPGTIPGKKPETPYSPKPGPKKAPKAENGKMPNWLTFGSMGIKIK